MTYALDAALNAVWAMEPQALETVLTIAAREHDVTPEALEAYKAKTLARAEQATVRDGVAIISATGPMMKRATFFSAISGATSYDVMARDLRVARDDPKVKGAILTLDTPGGEASGAGELAAMVKAFAEHKPIVAYVDGMAASAGYWIASAATEIVVDPTALLGSIGAQVAIRERDEAKGVTTHKFISSQSPMKNASPATAEGAAHMQGIVDAMAQVFVEDVARNRGVSTQTVLSDFGKGGIFVGQAAIDAGLADRTGTFEGVLAELAAGRRTHRKTGASMTTTNQTIEHDAAVAAARATERTRIHGLRRIAAGYRTAGAELDAAIDSGMSVEAFALEQAGKVIARGPVGQGDDAETLARRICGSDDESDGGGMYVPPLHGTVPPSRKPGQDTAEALAARIAAA